MMEYAWGDEGKLHRENGIFKECGWIGGQAEGCFLGKGQHGSGLKECSDRAYLGNAM